jgi:sterol desaturase/sphingolipid hydroxylase (fatty acid hydroxylase superfamily)
MVAAVGVGGVAGPGTFVFHETLYFGFCALWAAADLVPALRRYKIQPGQAHEGRQWSRKKQLRCLKLILFNHVFIQFPMMMLFHYVADLVGFRIELPLPPMSRLLWQIPIFYVIEDFWFYWLHRLLHWPKIYPLIHKMHHEHTAPFGMAAEYAHPVETVFLGIGTMLGPILFADHMFTVWVWLVFRLWETVEDHSGFDFPWNPTNLIPFWAGSAHHDFHHKTFQGPYSSVFTWCDWLFGTDALFRRQQADLSESKDPDWPRFYPAAFRGAPSKEILEARRSSRRIAGLEPEGAVSTKEE